MDQSMKKCPACEKVKARSEFCKNRSRKDGLHWQCRECHASANAKYRKSERGRAVQASYHAKYRNTERGRAARARAKAKYCQSEHGRVAQAKRDTRRGFGDERLKNFLFSYQGGLSALSGLPLLAPALDHCHKTDRVRGMINDLENCRLSWWAGDSLEGAIAALNKLKKQDGVKAEFLRQAIQYLQRTPEQVGVNFTVIGKRASLKRTKKATALIRERNTHNLNEALARISSVLEQVA